MHNSLIIPNPEMCLDMERKVGTLEETLSAREALQWVFFQMSVEGGIVQLVYFTRRTHEVLSSLLGLLLYETLDMGFRLAHGVVYL